MTYHADDIVSAASADGDILRQMEARYQKSEAMTAAILGSLSAHIAVLDREGRIIAVNAAWRRFALAQSDDLIEDAFIGENYLAVLANARGDKAEEAPLAYDGITRVLRGEIPTFALEYPCFTPTAELWFLMQVTPLQHVDGGVVVAHIDITERKQEELRKDLFISLASHELKTPVTSLKLFTQMAVRRSIKQGYTDLVPQLRTVEEQTNTLVRLVNDLLDVSRLHNGQIEMRRAAFALNDLITETVATVGAVAPEHRFAVATDAPCTVWGDRDRVSQVIINLLTNAVNYSPPGTTIHIHLTADDAQATLSVQDEGIGIEPTQQPKIFDPFYQIADLRERKTGLGMGLYISEQIIRRHGGAIWVVSERGQGATFTFTLPLALPGE